PIARRVLRAHGVLWPPNCFLHAPLLDAAAGGSILTGYGGDHLFLNWRRRPLGDLLARRRRPRPRDALRLAYAASPRWLRRLRERRQTELTPPSWLRPAAVKLFQSALAAEFAEAPITWNRWVRWQAGRRDMASTSWSMALLAADVDVLFRHPFLDGGFIDALARAGGRTGPGDRNA